MRAAIAAFAVLAVAATSAHANPTPEQPLDDSAGVVPDDDEAALDSELVALRTGSGVRFGVIVVKTTGGQSIEAFAHDRAVEWSTGTNAAAMLVLATKDRKSRLEVSDLLRPSFPDARAQSILDNIRGYLRRFDYAGAIRAVMTEVSNGAAGIAPDLESPHPQVPEPTDSTSAPTTPPPTTVPAEPPYTEPAYAPPPKDHTILWIGLVVGGMVILIAVVWAKSRVASRATMTASGMVPSGRPLWVETLVCIGLIIGGLIYVALIIAASGSSRRGYSSSSSGWSSSSGGGYSGGSSSGGGGGWSGGGASSSW